MNDKDDAAKLRQLRELVPATGAGIYVDTATRGPLAAEAAAAMRDADDWELRVGRATEGRAEDVEQRLEEARAVLAALLVADPAQIVVTHGAGDAIARVITAAGGRPIRVAEHVDPNTGAIDNWARPDDHTFQVLDATLSVGAIPLNAGDVGVDAIVFGADRWLLGPEATGALWIGPRLGPIEQPEMGRTALLGLARSVGWLEMYVGLDWAYERTSGNARRLRQALVATSGVHVVTPASFAGVICFSISNWPVDEALDELRRRVFAIVGPAPDERQIRASVAWFNTGEELDRFAAAVAELARHTPESLPRRPPLIVR